MEKTFELQLFSYVYGHANHWNVVSSEAPDFLCILNGKTVLGVEITELLGTETDARLRKIGGYALDLCAGGDFLHKDDPKNIAVEVVKYMPQGKEDQAKDVTAIVQEIPRFDKRVSLLQETISFKESKFPSYLASCSNIDLVVEDASNLFWFEEYKDFFYQFSSFIDRAKLINSPFREIFLLTRTKENKRVRIPLKVNLFIEDVLSFENLVSTSDYCRKKNFANAINLVFCCLAKIGLENLRFCKAKQSLGIAIGSHLYLYLPTGRELRDYQIFPDELETIGTIGEILNDVTDEEADVAQELIQTRKDERVYIPLFFEVDNNNVLPSKG